MAKETKKTDVFDMSQVKKIGVGNATGNEYYDKYTRYRSALAVRVVKMDINKAMALQYTQNDLVNEEVKDPKADLSKLEPPIIDIISKQSDGGGRLIVAKANKLKKVPVVLLADREGQIDWYLERKGIK